jgi:3',5'-cyclic AMP phosphodiesterase CpdA
MLTHIIHISDLHLGTPETDRKFEALRSFLQGWRKELAPQVNVAVVVTGDILNSPSGTQFDECKATLQRLSNDLSAPVFVVPGNHDVFQMGNALPAKLDLDGVRSQVKGRWVTIVTWLIESVYGWLMSRVARRLSSGRRTYSEKFEALPAAILPVLGPDAAHAPKSIRLAGPGVLLLDAGVLMIGADSAGAFSTDGFHFLAGGSVDQSQLTNISNVVREADAIHEAARNAARTVHHLHSDLQAYFALRDSHGAAVADEYAQLLRERITFFAVDFDAQLGSQALNFLGDAHRAAQSIVNDIRATGDAELYSAAQQTMKRIREVASRLPHAGQPLVKLCLVHHHLSPVPGTENGVFGDVSMVLENAGTLVDTLLNEGVDAALHGHHHRPYALRIGRLGSTEKGALRILSAGTPTAGPAEGCDQSFYRLGISAAGLDRIDEFRKATKAGWSQGSLKTLWTREGASSSEAWEAARRGGRPRVEMIDDLVVIDEFGDAYMATWNFGAHPESETLPYKIDPSKPSGLFTAPRASTGWSWSEDSSPSIAVDGFDLQGVRYHTGYATGYRGRLTRLGGSAENFVVTTKGRNVFATDAESALFMGYDSKELWEESTFNVRWQTQRLRLSVALPVSMEDHLGKAGNATAAISLGEDMPWAPIDLHRRTALLLGTPRVVLMCEVNHPVVNAKCRIRWLLPEKVLLSRATGAMSLAAVLRNAHEKLDEALDKYWSHPSSVSVWTRTLNPGQPGAVTALAGRGKLAEPFVGRTFPFGLSPVCRAFLGPRGIKDLRRSSKQDRGGLVSIDSTRHDWARLVPISTDAHTFGVVAVFGDEGSAKSMDSAGRTAQQLRRAIFDIVGVRSR